jgi:uncharacterized protein (DUF2147 family)
LEQEVMPVRITTPVLLAVILLAPHVYGADGDAILGLWRTMDREAQFEIYKCGAEYKVTETFPPELD